MVKYYNNPSGKSDKQAAHFRKQALQDEVRMQRLEKWFTKMTTPKPEKPRAPKKPKRVKPDVVKKELSEVSKKKRKGFFIWKNK